MSCTYSQFLIPKSADRQPGGGPAREFLEACTSAGVFAKSPSGVHVDYAGGGRPVVTPFDSFDEAPDLSSLHVDLVLSGPSDAERCPFGGLERLDDGETFPFREQFELQIAVCRRPAAVSLSGCCYGQEIDGLPPFYEPVGEEGSEGVFVRWNDYEQIRVPGLGRADFWIQLRVNRSWVFPTLQPDSVRALDSAFLELAESIFGIEFGEGCAFA